jgi:DNA-directed RNA polymerase subunit F
MYCTNDWSRDRCIKYIIRFDSRIKVFQSSTKYVSSDDDDAPFPISINEKVAIKRLGKELVVQVHLHEVQKYLLEQERKNTCEFKRLLKLEKEKNEELVQELVQAKETISSLKSSSGALQDLYDVLRKTHKDLEVWFDVLWASTLKSSSTLKIMKASTSNGCEICYNIDIDGLCAQGQHSNLEQVIVETCHEVIGKRMIIWSLKSRGLNKR